MNKRTKLVITIDFKWFCSFINLQSKQSRSTTIKIWSTAGAYTTLAPVPKSQPKTTTIM